MGKESEHKPVKLVIPILYSNAQLFNKCKNILVENFGNIDYISDEIPFNFTDYYNNEMGTPITRIFISFNKLIKPEELVSIKKWTNKLELELSIENKRKVNLDPGYLTLAKFILATTKDFQHRIYMGNGIYEEVTLYYKNKQWTHHEFTFPDYRTETYKKILTDIRNIYYEQLNEFK